MTWLRWGAVIAVALVVAFEAGRVRLMTSATEPRVCGPDLAVIGMGCPR